MSVASGAGIGAGAGAGAASGAVSIAPATDSSNTTAQRGLPWEQLGDIVRSVRESKGKPKALGPLQVATQLHTVRCVTLAGVKADCCDACDAVRAAGGQVYERNVTGAALETVRAVAMSSTPITAAQLAKQMAAFLRLPPTRGKRGQGVVAAVAPRRQRGYTVNKLTARGWDQLIRRLIRDDFLVEKVPAHCTLPIPPITSHSS